MQLNKIFENFRKFLHEDREQERLERLAQMGDEEARVELNKLKKRQETKMDPLTKELLASREYKEDFNNRENFTKFEEAIKKYRTYQNIKTARKVLEVFDEITNGHGIESLNMGDHELYGKVMEYVNQGDTYTLTLVLFDEVIYFTSYGDFIENYEGEERGEGLQAYFDQIESDVDTIQSNGNQRLKRSGIVASVEIIDEEYIYIFTEGYIWFENFYDVEYIEKKEKNQIKQIIEDSVGIGVNNIRVDDNKRIIVEIELDVDASEDLIPYFEELESFEKNRYKDIQILINRLFVENKQGRLF